MAMKDGALRRIVKEDEVMGRLLRRALRLEPFREARQIDILKYRPGRRISLRLDHAGEGCIAKLWYNRRGERIAAMLQSLHEQIAERPNTRLLVPVPILYDETAHTMVYREVPGVQLTGMLRKGLSRDWVEAVAQAAAELHAMSSEGLETRTPLDEVESIRRHVEAPQFPGAARGRFRQTLARLEEIVADAWDNSLLHRDLYDQQIFMLADGRVLLVDLDDLARGDAALDVGNLLAHLMVLSHWRRHPEKLLRVRERVTRHYCRRRAWQPGELSNMDWYETASLLRLAAIQASRGNGPLAQELLDLARAGTRREETARTRR